MYTSSMILLAVAAMAAKNTNPQKVPKDAVLLSNVKSLTMRAGQKTASRRVSPVSQLQCVGPIDVCNLYEIDVMRCTNEGSDYDADNIQWSCKASLPEDFKLGSTDVSCEGYESSQDPFVLKGSCGVEYRLLLTEKGEEKYGKPHSSDNDQLDQSPQSEKFAGYLFGAIFLAVLFIILRGIYRAWRADARPRGERPPRNYGGDGGPGDDDPPPPYDPYDRGAPPKKPRTYTPRTSTQSRASSSSSSRSTGTNQQEGWRPGFWTGAAAGAAGTHFASTRSQRQNQQQQQQQQQQPPQPQMQQRDGGGWFSGWGGGGGNQQPQVNVNIGANRPATSSSSSSSSPSYSTTRHESTGFGSTTRR